MSFSLLKKTAEVDALEVAKALSGDVRDFFSALRSDLVEANDKAASVVSEAEAEVEKFLARKAEALGVVDANKKLHDALAKLVG